MFVASPIIGRAFFRNIGTTRRQGIETSIDFRDDALLLSLDYSYTDARFRSLLTLNSPNNPLADADGQIQVRPGDRLPSVPADLFKATISFAVTEDWSLTLGGRAVSGRVLQGDEANLNPKTADYFVLSLSTRYRISGRFEAFGDIENLLGAKYETFGTFSPTSSVPIAEAPGATNSRSLSPAAPFSIRGGIRISL